MIVLTWPSGPEFLAERIITYMLNTSIHAFILKQSIRKHIMTVTLELHNNKKHIC